MNGNPMLYDLGPDRVRTQGEACFVAPQAVVIGRVTLGRDASVWFNAVIRADAEDIVIGARSNVQDGAVLHAPEAVRAHVLRMLDAGGIVARSGKVLPTPMHSICVHGDTPGAVANARQLRAALEGRGWQLAGLPQVLAG